MPTTRNKPAEFDSIADRYRDETADGRPVGKTINAVPAAHRLAGASHGSSRLALSSLPK